MFGLGARKRFAHEWTTKVHRKHPIAAVQRMLQEF